MPFPVDIHCITETEQNLGVVFPARYKTRMQQENGGELSTSDDAWQLFPFLDTSDHKRISRTCNHIALETAQARAWDCFPVHGIAIATNDCGDFLLLLPAQEEAASLGEEIFKWCHETGDVEKVADSIEDLYNH